MDQDRYCFAIVNKNDDGCDTVSMRYSTKDTAHAAAREYIKNDDDLDWEEWDVILIQVVGTFVHNLTLESRDVQSYHFAQPTPT